ncbi:hypothetical protein D3C78_1124670 [compost metagenome]
MEIMIYLHAAEVDQLGAVALRRLESHQGFLGGGRKYRFSLDIHGIGIEPPLAARLGQAHRIENPLRHAIFACRRLDLSFTDA